MKKKLAIFAMVMLTLASVVFASLDNQIKDNQSKLKSIQDSLKGLDKERTANKERQSQLEREIANLQEEIRQIESRLQQLTQDIETTEKAIVVKTDELLEAEKNVVFQNDRMEKRLRTMYKSGNFGYLEILLGAKDFSDMMTRMDKVQLLLDYDKDTLRTLIETRKFIEQTKLILEDKRTELESLKAEEVVEKLNHEAKLGQIKNKKVALEKDLVALENQLDELNEDAKKVTDVIKNLKLKKTYVGGRMQWPLPASYMKISSPFGNRIHPILHKSKLHTGIDIPAPKNTPVFAAQSGQVVYADWLGSYGKAVMIDHGGGIITLYGHNNSIEVSVGDKVNRGDIVSKIGTTGRSTGNHLHFEVRENGKYVDPIKYLRSN